MIKIEKRRRRKVDNFLCKKDAYLSRGEREILNSNTFNWQSGYYKSLRKKSRKFRKILRKSKKMIKAHNRYIPGFKDSWDDLATWEIIYWGNKLYNYDQYGRKHKRRYYW